VQQFRGGLVFKAQRLCVSLNSRLEGNNEEEEEKVRQEVAKPDRFLFQGKGGFDDCSGRGTGLDIRFRV